MRTSQFTNIIGAAVLGVTLIAFAPSTRALDVPGGSGWDAPITIPVGGFDSFTASIIANGAGPFRSPGAFDFLVNGGSASSDWAVISFDPYSFTAASLAAMLDPFAMWQLDFTLGFAGDITKNVTVNFELFLGGETVAVSGFEHIGSTDSSPVPDGGATLGLLALGLVGLGWLRRYAVNWLC